MLTGYQCEGGLLTMHRFAILFGLIALACYLLAAATLLVH